MRNEWLLIASIVLIFGSVVMFFKYFGMRGLYAFTIIATLTANIEVLILVDAFGMQMTLGNILFASTFLVTDIASEIKGREAANQIVNIGIAASLFFMVLTQSWMWYQPNAQDFAFTHMVAIFSHTPRLMAVGLVVYAVSQKFDVFLYHRWWKLTGSWDKDQRRFLWLRNNASTLLSQLLNSVLFTLGAFYGVYDNRSLLSLFASSYIIFVVTSLVDTPFVYWARHLYEQGKIAQE